jgi:uncharacterized protein with FMN-binding domain
MRRFVAVFVATVAGLIVLLGFKTSPAKAPRPVALSGVTPGASSAPPDSSAPVSSAPASSAPASSAAESSAPPSAAASSSPAPTASTASSSAKVSPTPTKSAAKPTAKPTPKPTPKPSSTTKTVTGSAVTVGEGRRVFGVVQVQLTLTNGKITAVTPVQVPQDDGHSSELSSYSIPILGQEVLSAQSASINAVSGATYTSLGYAQSVQAALDAAKR